MADLTPPTAPQGEATPGRPAEQIEQPELLLKRWCAISSALVTVLATLAIIGWHTNTTALFQVFPQFAPMQYNTAVCFISSALALFCAMRKWRAACFAIAFPGFLIAALTLVEHLYGVEIGNLDHLFHEAYVSTRTEHLGRPSLFTSISFVLTFLALFGTVMKPGGQLTSSIIAILSSLIVSISLLGLSGYLVGLSDAHTWSLLAQMSVPTVVCFLSLGMGILIISWREFRKANEQQAHWAPIAVLIATVTITLILTDAIHSEELRNIRQKSLSNAVAVESALSSELSNRQHSIRRMASRWAAGGAHVRSRWEVDVNEYLADDVGYRFIAWADENLIYRWVVPASPEITEGVTSALPEELNPVDFLESFRTCANVSIRYMGRYHGELSVVAPIINDQGLVGGYIIANFNKRIFFDTLLPKEFAQGYEFTISMDDQVVYQRGPEIASSDNAWILEKTFNLHGRDWRLQIWPTANTLSSEHIFYSKLIGAMGVTVSILLALATYLAQVAAVKSRQSARRNVRLQTEISERIRSQNELQRASALNNAIVMHSAHAVITANPDGIITSFNPAAERMLGYKAEELVGKHTPAIIHDLGEVAARANQLSRQYKDKVEPGFDAFVYEARKGIDSQIEWTYIRKNGSRFPVSLAVTAITNDQGDITGYLGVAVDISELKYAMAELKSTHKQLLDAANETSRMKSQFLANMSHEIRTPMNGVLGMAELLGDTDLTDTQREYIGIIQQSGNALLAIINDILDSAKIESGRIDLQETPFNIADVLKGVMQTVSPTAIKKNIRLSSEVDSRITSNVVGDPGRLRQVLLNLASNAVKFTNQGEVALKVSLLSEDEEVYRLNFKVQDSGIGINPDSIAHIFQPFTQADNTNKRLYGGTGLGLTISSQIVQAMGGSIRVESREKEGSEFWFDLTLMKTEEQVQSLEAPAPAAKKKKSRSITQAIRLAQKDGQKLSILLAEDNPVNQQVTTMQLKRLGIDADVAENGEEALQAIRSKHYDVVLMDCQMPVMDGYEASREIRRQFPESPVHIIALTANAMKEDRKKCLEAGMNDYLSKPLTAKDLAEALDRMNNNTIPPEPAEDENAPSQAVDFERLREVTGDDEQLFKDISNQYLDQADEIIGELDQAILAADREQTRKLAHKLAGSSATCGMNAVVEPLRALEALPANEFSGAVELFRELNRQMERIRQELANHP